MMSATTPHRMDALDGDWDNVRMFVPLGREKGCEDRFAMVSHRGTERARENSVLLEGRQGRLTMVP